MIPKYPDSIECFLIDRHFFLNNGQITIMTMVYVVLCKERVATQSLKDCYHATKQLCMNHNEGYIPEGS